MMDVREVSRLAVEVVSRNLGQCSQSELIRKMIYELGAEGGSDLAKEGIKQAIDDGFLFDAGKGLLTIV